MINACWLRGKATGLRFSALGAKAPRWSSVVQLRGVGPEASDLSPDNRFGPRPRFAPLAQVYRIGLIAGDSSGDPGGRQPRKNGIRMGSYVAACVFFSTIFRKSPVGLTTAITGVRAWKLR
jgi:hypothetical protein